MSSSQVLIHDIKKNFFLIQKNLKKFQMVKKFIFFHRERKISLVSR